METKRISVVVEKSESGDFDARFVMSATSPDRMLDTIEPSAYDKSIGKKLIALWQHNHDQPMGFWENVRFESGKLIGDLKLASTNLGLMIKQLLLDKVPLGASIGFRGVGEPNSKGGYHFKEIELLECSIVSVPAHPKAVEIAKSFGISLPVGETDSKNGQMTESKKSINRAKSAILQAKRTLKKGK